MHLVSNDKINDRHLDDFIIIYNYTSTHMQIYMYSIYVHELI